MGRWEDSEAGKEGASSLTGKVTGGPGDLQPSQTPVSSPPSFSGGTMHYFGFAHGPPEQSPHVSDVA